MPSRFDADHYAELFGRVAAMRDHREALDDELAAGSIDLASLFGRASADPVVASTKILGLIEAMPEYGKVQTRRAFAELSISEAAHVGSVTAEQRAGLPDALERHKR